LKVKEIPQDIKKSYVNFHLATIEGDKQAIKERDAVAKKLTPLQMKGAQVK
jgi:hypothetical protein